MTDVWTGNQPNGSVVEYSRDVVPGNGTVWNAKVRGDNVTLTGNSPTEMTREQVEAGLQVNSPEGRRDRFQGQHPSESEGQEDRRSPMYNKGKQLLMDCTACSGTGKTKSDSGKGFTSEPCAKCGGSGKQEVEQLPPDTNPYAK